MSDPGTPQNAQLPNGAAAAAPAKRKPLNPRVRLGLMIGAGVILAVGLIFGLEWLLHGRFMISTDDAYLRADSVTVSPRVSGYIDEIYIKENQHVAAGQPLLHIDKRTYQDTLSQQSASVTARMADVDAKSGCQDGYSAKLFVGIRRFGPMSLNAVLGALECDLVVVPKAEAAPERRALSANKAGAFRALPPLDEGSTI